MHLIQDHLNSGVFLILFSAKVWHFYLAIFIILILQFALMYWVFYGKKGRAIAAKKAAAKAGVVSGSGTIAMDLPLEDEEVEKKNEEIEAVNTETEAVPFLVVDEDTIKEDVAADVAAAEAIPVQEEPAEEPIKLVQKTEPVAEEPKPAPVQAEKKPAAARKKKAVIMEEEEISKDDPIRRMKPIVITKSDLQEADKNYKK